MKYPGCIKEFNYINDIGEPKKIVIYPPKEKCCNTCSHCDVLDYYCYEHYKPINLDDVCDKWDEYQDD